MEKDRGVALSSAVEAIGRNAAVQVPGNTIIDPEKVMRNMLKAVGPKGNQVDYLPMEVIMGFHENPYTQFNIDYTAGAPADPNVPVRIGSVLGLPGVYEEFDLPPGAADSGAVKDDGGLGCKHIRGFSRLTNGMSVLINEIKIFSDDTKQLSSAIKYKMMGFDRVSDTDTTNVLSTALKSDFRVNELVVYGKWWLNVRQYLEFSAIAGEEFQVLLKIAGFAGVDNIISF